jgi:hypothetical protein
MKKIDKRKTYCASQSRFCIHRLVFTYITYRTEQKYSRKIDGKSKYLIEKNNQNILVS